MNDMSLKQQFYKKRKEGRSCGYDRLPCPQILACSNRYRPEGMTKMTESQRAVLKLQW